VEVIANPSSLAIGDPCSVNGESDRASRAGLLPLDSRNWHKRRNLGKDIERGASKAEPQDAAAQAEEPGTILAVRID
jgi:hypothetical protein